MTERSNYVAYRVFLCWIGITVIAKLPIQLYVINDRASLLIAALIGAIGATWMGQGIWREWQEEEQRRKAEEVARAETDLKQRLEKDIAANPDYAREILKRYPDPASLASMSTRDQAHGSHSNVDSHLNADTRPGAGSNPAANTNPGADPHS